MQVENWPAIFSAIEAAIRSYFVRPGGPIIESDVPGVMKRIEKEIQDCDGTVAEKKPEHKTKLPNDETRGAIEQAERIIELTYELPEKATEFGESVADKCQGIAETIEVNNFVTGAQKVALDNMESGVKRWLS